MAQKICATQTTSCTDLTCCLPQKSPILEIPRDVVIRILSLLPAKKIGTIGLVCKQFHDHVEKKNAWQSLFVHFFPSVKQDVKVGYKSYYRSYSNVRRKIYALHTFHLDKNSRLPFLKNNPIFTESILSFAIKDETLFVSSESKTIIAWDISAAKAITNFQGHTSMVHALAVNNDTLYSGSGDHTAIAWDIKAGKLNRVFKGHTGPIYSIAVKNEMLFSGSRDSTIIRWDSKTGDKIAVYQGHLSMVNALAIDGDTLYSGSEDHTIIAWDIKTGRLKTILRGHTGPVNTLAVGNGILVSGSQDRTIIAWDLKTDNRIMTLRGHKDSIYSLAFDREILFSGANDLCVMAWDTKIGECIATFSEHKAGVFTIAANNGRLFSGHSDSVIKFYNFGANNPTILNQLAEMLETWTPEIMEKALEQFLNFSEIIQNGVYRELHKIVEPFENEYSGCAKDAFHGKNGQSATPDQKALAIRNYARSLSFS